MTFPAVGPVGDDWLNELVAELLEPNRLNLLVDSTDAQILRDVPEIDTRLLRGILDASTAALSKTMLPGLVTGLTPLELPDEAHALVDSMVGSGLDLRVLLRIYRSGQHATIQNLSHQVYMSSLDEDLTRQLTLRVVACTTDWAGSALETLSGAFTADRELDLPGMFARRRETVRAILAGSEVDSAKAEARLGYRFEDRHLAYIIWADDDGPVLAGSLERTAQEIGEALDSRGVFTLSCGERTMWAWARTGRDAPMEAPRHEWQSAIRVAFGLPGRGMAGFRRSHAEALAAQRISKSALSLRRVVNYDAIELQHLVSQDDAAMRAFVERELGDLAGLDANAARLRETLGCYLDSMCSVEATARELGVHRNTVRYRLERIERLLGHSVESRRLKLEVALNCARTLRRK